MADPGEIDPVKYGVLWQKVQDYERRFDVLDKKIDRMEDQVDKLVALAHQGRGGLFAGMAFISMISAFVGYLTNWFHGVK
jgi:hypothetical protein